MNVGEFMSPYDRVIIPFNLDLALKHTNPKWQLNNQITKLVVEYIKFYPDMTVDDLKSVGRCFPTEFTDK